MVSNVQIERISDSIPNIASSPLSFLYATSNITIVIPIVKILNTCKSIKNLAGSKFLKPKFINIKYNTITVATVMFFNTLLLIFFFFSSDIVVCFLISSSIFSNFSLSNSSVSFTIKSFLFPFFEV